MASLIPVGAWPLTVFSILIYCTGHPLGTHNSDKLLVILIDGVRHNYVSRDPELRGFQRIKNNGVTAEFVTPIYPANSYPNRYAIATGLFGESSGFVHNYMYDEEADDLFLTPPHPNATHAHWWNRAEPLWITAEKRGIKSAIYWWDGCQVEIGGERPSFCLGYVPAGQWENVDRAVEDAWKDIANKFANESYRLAMVYYEGPDFKGHSFGPDSPETMQAMRNIDVLLNKLQDELERRNLDNEVNVVIVSDHGMTNGKSGVKNIIDLNHVIDVRDVEMMIGGDTLTMIRPKEGKIEKVYNDIINANVSGLHVYKKEDIPDEYHIKNSKRTQSILLVPEISYYINQISDASIMVPYKANNAIIEGIHGYDPYSVTDMRTIMFAKGPAFKRNFQLGPLHMTDHYNIFCHALNMEALPNNGSWDRVKDMMIE